MSIDTQPRKSFFSTTTGMVTGLAGLGTAAVGALTLATQAGWIGDSDSTSTASSTPTTAVANAGGITASPASSPGAAVPNVTVDPTSLSLDTWSSKERTVTLRNQDAASITVARPTVTGTDAAQFTAADVDCTRASLNSGRSCEIKVTYAPSASGQHTARLVITVNGRFDKEVTLRGSRLL